MDTAPTKISTPFANTATTDYKRAIPQTTSTPGQASYDKGFPPVTFQDPDTTGIPPDGRDVNGILNEITKPLQWYSAGGGFPYNSTFATAIGGYPKGARVLRTDAQGYWMSTADNNSADPEAFGADWVPDQVYGITEITSLTGGTTILTALQASRDIISISGTLIADVTITFPTYKTKWEIINKTTGAYTVTLKTASGTGVVLQSGRSNKIYGDGTNINFLSGTMLCGVGTITVLNDNTIESTLLITFSDKYMYSHTVHAPSNFDGFISTLHIQYGGMLFLRIICDSPVSGDKTFTFYFYKTPIN